jgi:2'-5' RNA ligase
MNQEKLLREALKEVVAFEMDTRPIRTWGVVENAQQVLASVGEKTDIEKLVEKIDEIEAQAGLASTTVNAVTHMIRDYITAEFGGEDATDGS